MSFLVAIHCRDYLIAPIIRTRAIDSIQQTLIHIATRKLILRPIRRHDRNIAQTDIRAHARATADHIS